MKEYLVSMFDGYSSIKYKILADNYDLAVKKLGLLPPGYIWSVEPTPTKK